MLLVGCNAVQQNPDANNSTSGISDTTNVDDAKENGNTNPSDDANIDDTDVLQAEDIAIHTEYGDLHYSAQWKEFLLTEQSTKGETVEVVFSAQINDESFPLFNIVIGNEDGNPAGTILADDGTQRNVYVHMKEIVESDTLNEDEQNRLYAMQEDINYLLDSLK